MQRRPEIGAGHRVVRGQALDGRAPQRDRLVQVSVDRGLGVRCGGTAVARVRVLDGQRREGAAETRLEVGPCLLLAARPRQRLPADVHGATHRLHVTDDLGQVTQQPDRGLRGLRARRIVRGPGRQFLLCDEDRLVQVGRVAP